MTALGRKLRQEVTGFVSIVPIPNSGMALGAGDDFRAIKLGRKLAEAAGDAICEPVLRWKKAQEPAHKVGGFRNPDKFEANLELIERPKNPVVLFDDVITTGSQMMAAARVLEKKSVTTLMGLTVLKAVKTQEPTAFKWTEFELDVSRKPITLDW